MNTKTPTLFCLKNPMVKQSKLHHYLRLTLFSLLSLFSVIVYAAAPVIRGDFNVSGGQATYSLPIEVVPGRNGHQPSLAISYASDSPNGYLGMGWDISGLSAITRCGKNLHKDGRWGGVRLNNDDRYCLDGQRLVAITGQDGGDLTEYRLENNGYSKIVSYKTDYRGHGPSHFKVWKKDGSVYEYGMENTAQVNLPGHPHHIYKWALNKVTDHTKNNHIIFKYVENTAAGTHKIDVISYEGGSIKFDYVGRTDSTSQYLMGSKLTRSQRLSKIVVNNQSEQAVRNYILAYGESDVTNRSLLSSIQMCTGKGTECSSPISFEWKSQGNATVTSSNTSFIFPKFVDTNRDGHLDKYGIKRGWDQVGTEYCEFSKPDFVGWTVVDPDGNETTKSTGNYQLISVNGTFKIETETGEISGSGSYCGGGNSYKKKKFTATAKKGGLASKVLI
ncbi:hypothetical protein VINI7043_07680 [Vibrio nigripulchritudo ATCC 27043]|uniref:SpvB/TcaC N-terminal domain-containing protein n=1 Tax=Vibrio nigripulchritudo TaxID=28173 RepID=UPI00021C1F8D|nr:SpvB/TcaC N-terminal domain-containing protein [Vibrio nigripulchritudo]EGU57676.1 hypothetical protein VINI7043_07680 [Vibrio nigripulchritudo ATCC 27043]